MTISEVSKEYNISTDTLRYYERIGLLPKVHRNKSGIRDYTKEDIGWIEFIKCMRDAGVSIEALIEYVALFQQGDETILARKNILMDQKARMEEKMEELKRCLDRLNYKISYYEKCSGPQSFIDKENE